MPRRRKHTAKASVTPSSTVTDPRIREILGLYDTTTTGIEVNEFTALNHAAVYRAVSIIANAIGVLPLKVYRRLGDTRQEAVDHPATRLLSVSPDSWRTAAVFRETLTAHALLRGNGYAEIVRNTRGQAIELHLLDPRLVRIDWSNKRPVYRVTPRTGGSPVELDHDQVIHIPALSWDGFEGRPPITCARESIGLGLAADRFGAMFYGKGGRPMGFLKKAARLTKTERDTLRQEWAELHEGVDNFWNVGVLSGGLEWQAVGISPKDAEFLSTRQFQIREIARWFGVPPHMLADLEKATYSNIEHMLIEFVMFTLMPWVRRWENELRLKLFTRVEQFTYYVEFNLDAMLRGDALNRAMANEIRLRNGALTPNEWRKQDNQPGFGEIGDKPLILASQLATLEQAASGELAQLRMGTPPADE